MSTPRQERDLTTYEGLREELIDLSQQYDELLAKSQRETFPLRELARWLHCTPSLRRGNAESTYEAVLAKIAGMLR